MDQWYRSVISGERIGAGAALLRFALDVVSWGYAAGMAVRNAMFDWGIRKQVKVGATVISVGNITTGGTGKTPTVILLVKELQRMGRKPAVLTRGYGTPSRAEGGSGKSDEVMVIEHECPGVPVVVNADRVAGAKAAISMHGADVLVMDDGFQHRRLARDLNIVLLDATEPMGIPGVIPRGTWREPPCTLKRANMAMLTRCEQVRPELADLAAGLLTQWVSPRAIFKQRTMVTGIYDQAGNPVPLVAGASGGHRVVAFAGIGNPNGFLHTARSLGLEVVAGCWLDDHHRYTRDDLVRLLKGTAAKRAEAWVTTLKDWVKVKEIAAEVPGLPPVWHVRIEARLEGHEQELLRARLRTLGAG